MRKTLINEIVQKMEQLPKEVQKDVCKYICSLRKEVVTNGKERTSK